METVSDLKGQSLVLRKYVEGNEKNINSAILNYFQAGKREIRQFTIMKLFATSLNNFMFTYLRT
jgi:secreted Zn-dependent insulinase-like peptidase